MLKKGRYTSSAKPMFVHIYRQGKFPIAQQGGFASACPTSIIAERLSARYPNPAVRSRLCRMRNHTHSSNITTLVITPLRGIAYLCPNLAAVHLYAIGQNYTTRWAPCSSPNKQNNRSFSLKQSKSSSHIINV